MLISKSRFRKLSLPACGRQAREPINPAYFGEIATPACRNVYHGTFQQHEALRRAGTHLSGARNDGVVKRFFPLNRNLGYK